MKNKALGPLALLLSVTSLIFSCLFLASCGSGDGQGHGGELSLADVKVESTGEKTLLPERTSGGEKNEFFILTETGTGDRMVVSSDSADIVDKKTYERNMKIAEEYGIILGEIGTDNISTRVKNDVFSGRCDYGMINMTASPSAPLLIEEQCLEELVSLGFDASSDGYYKGLTESLAIGNDIYITAGNATPSVFRATSVVMLNTELCSELSLDVGSVVSAVTDGSFTYELMYRYSSALVGESSEISISDGAKYISASPEDASALFFSGDVDFFDFDSTSDSFTALEFDDTTTEIYKAMQLLYGMDEDSDVYDGLDKKVGVTPLFRVADISELELLAGENAPYIALPMPKMRADQKNYSCLASAPNFSCTAIPAEADDAEYALKVMNLIYSLSDDVYATLCDSVSPSDAALAREMLDEIRDSVTGDVIAMFGWGDTDGFMRSAINEHLRASVFSMRGAERISAAVTALSITFNDLHSK